MTYRLWSIGNGALWLPSSVTGMDMARVVENRERWEAFQSRVMRECFGYLRGVGE